MSLIITGIIKVEIPINMSILEFCRNGDEVYSLHQGLKLSFVEYAEMQ